MLLENKVALVTHSVSGIGYEIALAMLKEGAKVIICASNRERANQVRMKLNQENPEYEVAVIICDFMDVEDLDRKIDGVMDHFKKIDILINVQDFYYRSSKSFNLSNYEQTLGFYLKSLLNTIEVVTRNMKDQKDGLILNLGAEATYNLKEHRIKTDSFNKVLSGLTKTLALEFAEHNIRVNTVCPGMAKHVYSDEEYNEILSQIPLGRLGTSEEIIHLILFLSSHYGSYISGNIIKIDGLIEG